MLKESKGRREEDAAIRAYGNRPEIDESEHSL
jgi:hypothetical protein